MPIVLDVDVTEASIRQIDPSLREAITVNGEVHQRLRATMIDDLIFVWRYSVGVAR